MEDIGTNFLFHKTISSSILKNLIDAQVDYIKLSYRKGSFKPMDNVGQTALYSNDYIQ